MDKDKSAVPTVAVEQAVDGHEVGWGEHARQVLARILPELRELAWMDDPTDPELSLAIERIDGRSLRLRGAVFERWLVLWHEVKGTRPNPATPNNLSVCAEEKVSTMIRLLDRKARQGQTPLNARELYAFVCDPSEPGFDTARNRFCRDDVPALVALDVWRHEPVIGLVRGRDGTTREEVRGHRFWPGPALVSFIDLVFNPLRLRQIAAFVAAHGESLGAILSAHPIAPLMALPANDEPMSNPSQEETA